MHGMERWLGSWLAGWLAECYEFRTCVLCENMDRVSVPRVYYIVWHHLAYCEVYRNPLLSVVLCLCAKVHYIRQLINDEYITQGGAVVYVEHSICQIRHIRFRRRYAQWMHLMGSWMGCVLCRNSNSKCKQSENQGGGEEAVYVVLRQKWKSALFYQI